MSSKPTSRPSCARGSARSSTRRARPGVEALDERCLPSTSPIDIGNGTLTFFARYGTENWTRITDRPDGPGIRLNAYSSDESALVLDYINVGRIVYHGSTRADHFENLTGLSCEVHGGDGDD